MVNLVPLNENLVIQGMIENPAQTESGILIPDTIEKERPTQGVVIAVSEKIKEIKVGDKVLFSKYGATELEVDGEEILIVGIEDVYAVVKD